MSVYLDMAHDAGARGEEAEQLAQAIEFDQWRQAEKAELEKAREVVRMTDKLSERVHNAVANKGPRTNNAAALANEVAALEQRVEEAEEGSRRSAEMWEAIYADRKRLRKRVERLETFMRYVDDENGYKDGMTLFEHDEFWKEYREALAEEKA